MSKDLNQWCGEHGTNADMTLYSNAHHLLQPIMGRMRLVAAGHAELTPETAEYMVDRMFLLIALIDEDDRPLYIED